MSWCVNMRNRSMYLLWIATWFNFELAHALAAYNGSFTVFRRLHDESLA
jgi:hypothetical protein